MPTPLASSRLVLAWRVVGDRREPVLSERWLAFCRALAAWPGAPLSVERRLVMGAGDALLADAIVVTVDGLHVLADRLELERDVAQLVRPLLAGARCRLLRGERELEREGLAFKALDAAELTPGPVEPLSPATHGALAGTIGALVESCDRAALSVLLAPAGDRLLRCRLRLTASGRLPPAALAHAAALCDAPAEAWRRPRMVGGPLPEPDDEPIELVDAAQLAALPVAQATLERTSTRGRSRALGHTLAGVPFRLTDAGRRRPTAVVGERAARRAALAGAAGQDAAAGRRIVVLDLSGDRAAWLPEPLRRPAIVARSAARCRLRAGTTLVIECADRLPHAELASLLAAARRTGAAVILGTAQLSRRRQRLAGTIVAVSGGEAALGHSFVGGPLRPGQAFVYRRDEPRRAPVQLRLATVRCARTP